jgi:hypothetical protein
VTPDDLLLFDPRLSELDDKFVEFERFSVLNSDKTYLVFEVSNKRTTA